MGTFSAELIFGQYQYGTMSETPGIVYKTIQLGAPTLFFNFTLGALDSAVSFSRASTATMYDSTGTIVSVANDVPRFEYDPITLQPKGILLELTRTNSMLHSHDLTNVAWGKSAVTISAGASAGPRGAATMTKVITDSAAATVSSGVIESFTKAASATQYTFSGHFKAGEFNRVRIRFYDTGLPSNQCDVTVSLVDGSITAGPTAGGTFTGASAHIVQLANGVWRVGLTGTSSTETGIAVAAYPRDSVATTGDGTSGIYMDAFQFEISPSMTSYIPTTTVGLTRQQDIMQMTGTAFSNWYNPVEGTFVAEFDWDDGSASNASNRGVFCVSDTTVNDRMFFHNNTAAAFSVRDDAVIQVTGLGGEPDVAHGVRVKMAGAYKLNDFAFTANGRTISTDSSGTIPTVSQINFGGVNAVTTSMNGHLRSFAYYNTRLSNAKLVELST